MIAAYRGVEVVEAEAGANQRNHGQADAPRARHIGVARALRKLAGVETNEQIEALKAYFPRQLAARLPLIWRAEPGGVDKAKSPLAIASHKPSSLCLAPPLSTSEQFSVKSGHARVVGPFEIGDWVVDKPPDDVLVSITIGIKQMSVLCAYFHDEASLQHLESVLGPTVRSARIAARFLGNTTTFARRALAFVSAPIAASNSRSKSEPSLRAPICR